jgi:hypothetical protein
VQDASVITPEVVANYLAANIHYPRRGVSTAEPRPRRTRSLWLVVRRTAIRRHAHCELQIPNRTAVEMQERLTRQTYLL